MLQIKLITLVLAMAMLFGCATKPQVTTDYEASYNFAGLKTIFIKDDHQEAKDDIRISPFTWNHIKNLFSTELAKRYQVVDTEAKADFTVTYHIVLEESLEANNLDAMVGLGAGGYRWQSAFAYRPTLDSPVRVYNQGILIVDMVDAKTKQPIWRGLVSKRLSKSLSPQKQRDILGAAVLDVLAQFPPK